jgi:hypothetical protein
VFPLFFLILGSGLPTRKHNGGYPWFIPIVNSDGDLFLVACLFLQGITYTQAVEIFLKTVAKKYVFFEEEPYCYLCESVFASSPSYRQTIRRKSKPFYMKLNENQKMVMAADILVLRIGIAMTRST